MTVTIQATDIVKTYGRIQALRNLSVSVNQGEIFGLLGANGVGKTTLIKILIGALKANSGAVAVLGLDPQRDKQALRRQIGYMPQQPALYDDLTARENVRFFAQAHQEVANLENQISGVLEFLDLTDRANDPVYGFSGGMKQRVSLACALIHQPKLLFLDEPSTGVDLKLRELLWSHFRELAEQGVTIIVSTHQMDEALHCNRVAIMRAGQVLACDSPRQLLARGRATVTVWQPANSQTYTFDNYRDELPQVLGIAAQYPRLEIQEDTLEDVVLRLIGEQELPND